MQLKEREWQHQLVGGCIVEQSTVCRCPFTVPLLLLPAGREARKTDVSEDEMKLQFCLDALDDADPFALEVRLTRASLFFGLV